MVQMSPADQVVIKAIPGNQKCMECGMKNPQWASVSFGTVFCLECSGVHRSLGVHISFVRSIAMDSWTDKQLSLMKVGGNAKCADYLKAHGVQVLQQGSSTIRQRYDNPTAQLYKEVLKARAEGKPEPTSLPPKPTSSSSSITLTTTTTTTPTVGTEDPNGMERLTGESEQQYVVRQTRLRQEARARMAAKFGNNHHQTSSMGSSSSAAGGRMAGIGSDSSYDPTRGGYGTSADSVVTGLSSAMSSLGTMTRNVGTKLNQQYQDESTQRTLQDLTGSISSTSSSLWSSFSAAANTVAASLAQPEDSTDGLSEFQQRMQSQRPAQSKYGGFGSDMKSGTGMPATSGSGIGSAGISTSTVAEAQGLPGEDRNGIERLTGESDEQYVMRQTRLRDEAKARMAAKFGGGGMTSASSSGSYSNHGGMGHNSSLHSAAGMTRNGNSNHSAAAAGITSMSAPSSGNNGAVQSTTPPRSAPSSGGFAGSATKVKVDSSEDFFSNFGT